MMDEMPVFKNATCRGSYLLRSACGHCERCEWEMKQLRGKTITFAEPSGDKEETLAQDIQWLLDLGPRGKRLADRTTAISEDNVKLCDQMDAVVKSLGEDPDSFDPQWAHVHVAKLMAGLPYEPTDAMISSVSGVVGPYAAKKIWQRMCDIARRTAPIEKGTPREPIAWLYVETRGVVTMTYPSMRRLRPDQMDQTTTSYTETPLYASSTEGAAMAALQELVVLKEMKEHIRFCLELRSTGDRGDIPRMQAEYDRRKPLAWAAARALLAIAPPTEQKEWK